MSTIRVNDTTFTVSADFSIADLKKVKADRPDSLVLYKTDEENHKTPYFAVTAGEKDGFNANGAVFSVDSILTGKATITMPLPAIERDKVKDYVADRVGFLKRNLDLIETQVADAIVQIDNDRAAVLASIEGLDEPVPADDSAF